MQQFKDLKLSRIPGAAKDIRLVKLQKFSYAHQCLSLSPLDLIVSVVSA